jgi:hypothetical protein
MQIHIVAKGNYFEHYGKALTNACRELGHDVHWFKEDTYEVPYFKADLHIVVGPNVYNHQTVLRLDGHRVGILTEQLPHIEAPLSPFVIDRAQQFQRHYPVYHRYVDWSAAHCGWLRVTFPGINLIYFPHGWIDHGLTPVKSSDCKYDICFLGENSRRREMILDQIKALGLSVYPRSRGVWGQEKLEAIRNSKLILNVHFSDGPKSFEAHRIFDAASLGRPFLSEEMNAYGFEDIILQAEYEKIPQRARVLLRSNRQLDKRGRLQIEELSKFKLTTLIDALVNNKEHAYGEG